MPSGRPATKPWRTEGLPAGDGERHRGRSPNWWLVLLIFGLGYFLLFGGLSFQDALGGPPKVSYTEFTTQVEQRNVAEVFSRGDTIEGKLRQPRPLPGQDAGGQNVRTYQKFTTERPTFAQDDLLTALKNSGATVSATPLTQQRGILANLLISVAPTLLLFVFWYWLFKRSEKLGMGMFGGFWKKHKPVDPESVRVTFDDVAGIDEVKAEINEVVDYLRDPEKYRKLGARVPKGVLLAGAPGTGKTLLARATAGEANVPFFSASGSEFIEMIVGVGAYRVRELFEEARKVAPSIIFIDEIDTIGRSRSSAIAVGGHDEREQTLNQILTEMDGFSGAEGVVVLAATNRPDVLDPALLRPGRFDRTITVNAPDRKGRAAILRVHTRKVPLASDVDLDQFAASTPGMTGADLANLVNEAALTAARHGQTHITNQDLIEALEKVQLGIARNVVMSEEQRRRTAYHEAGHALLGMLQPGADPVRKVSIIPRGHALGVTLSTPEDDRYVYSEEYLRGRIIGAVGGMAAEEEVLGVVTTGSESDLENATNIARGMVGRWGMSDHIGPVSVLPKEGDPHMAGVSDAMLGIVDGEVRRIIDECYAEARKLLQDNRDKLDNIVAELLAHETLGEAEVYAAAGIPRVAAAHP
ncbi:ATP-dependent zinc metalloprotease FtsH [Mycobacterium xenopi]|uniref:ATP-dependent zinc metalloprotease FtsH n=1 Tax=Mycobacterium xenopi TaxID=1789 RepID=UPI000A22CE28|nr:ATP-dependent zinc metalloprotease FtsH [Mycobacterium xenopi]MDA3637920.1 ATP-dependent zinc metalloprotease FtsH [Mycobacterium xenopi]MDA3655989.1 ATP-dependent zinc metalloprotease FtsH [Mycobacterium xenopi]MDA3660693.1 ATP-dependent zinc metalloprotease FtsH [Mycobacterium xenopi]ORX09373.1 cell division protein FtsH [Mycobacterium xenopi]